MRVRISRKAGRGRGDNHDKSWSKSFQSKAASVRARVSGTRRKRQGKGERRSSVEIQWKRKSGRGLVTIENETEKVEEGDEDESD